MAEPIEMPFGLLARMGPRNYVLDGGPVTTLEGAILGKGSPIVKYRGLLNRSISFWVVDSGVPKEAQVQSYSSLIIILLQLDSMIHTDSHASVDDVITVHRLRLMPLFMSGCITIAT